MLQKTIAGMLAATLAAAALLAATATAQTETTLYNIPYGSFVGLVLDGAGNMYGAAIVGGTNQAGTIYKLSQVSGTWQQTTLYTFTGGADGSHPFSPLTFDASGNLYGTTQLGGAHNTGVVFKLTPTSSGEWQESVLYSFTGLADGGYPGTGNLVFDKQGNLYGSNVAGGNTSTISCGNTGGCGVAFRLSPQSDGTWKYKILHTFFGGWDGVGPAQLTFDKYGVLYGSAAGAWGGFELPSGPGLVFKLTPTSNPHAGWTETAVYSFTGGNDGGLPGKIFFGSDGNIYGAGADGGTSPNCVSGYQTVIGCGVVFEIAHTSSGWQESALYSFFGTTDGSGPDSLLMSQGKLYGTTFGGGLTNFPGGVVFELSQATSGWTESVLYSFSGINDGSNPQSLAIDASGHFIGTTRNGGSNNNGVVFELVP